MTGPDPRPATPAASDDDQAAQPGAVTVDPAVDPAHLAGPDVADPGGSAEAVAPQTTPEIDPGTQVELDLGIVSTGDARVDAALAELEGLAGLPVADHPALFEGVHQGLHSALTELDEG